MALTILIVEDDVEVRRALERHLRKAGHEVCMPLSAPYAAGALQLLEREPIDAVILDLLLGDHTFDGFDIARHMQRHPEWSKIPVFLTTGLDEAEIQRRATEYAFGGLSAVNLGKPTDMALLLDSLSDIEARRRAGGNP